MDGARAAAGAGRHRRRDIRHDAQCPRRPSSRPAICRVRWRRPSRTRAAGSRSAAGDDIDALEPWLAAQPAVGAALVLDDPRPRAGTALALAVAGSDGRTVAAEGPVGAARLLALIERLGVPLVAHEVKPLLVARFAEDPAAAPLAVAFDTQIAAYILNASLRSQTIADVVAEQLDLILPPAKELPAFARAGLEALSAIATPRPARRGPGA